MTRGPLTTHAVLGAFRAAKDAGGARVAAGAWGLRALISAGEARVWGGRVRTTRRHRPPLDSVASDPVPGRGAGAERASGAPLCALLRAPWARARAGKERGPGACDVTAAGSEASAPRPSCERVWQLKIIGKQISLRARQNASRRVMIFHYRCGKLRPPYGSGN